MNKFKNDQNDLIWAPQPCYSKTFVQRERTEDELGRKMFARATIILNISEKDSQCGWGGFKWIFMRFSALVALENWVHVVVACTSSLNCIIFNLIKFQFVGEWINWLCGLSNYLRWYKILYLHVGSAACILNIDCNEIFAIFFIIP